MNKKHLKIGDLVKLKHKQWNHIGVVTEIEMKHKGIDPSFVEVMWLGFHFRHLERIENLEVVNEKR